MYAIKILDPFFGPGSFTAGRLAMESGSDSGSEAPSSILLQMVNEEGNNETVHQFFLLNLIHQNRNQSRRVQVIQVRPFNEEDTYDCEEETGRATSYVEKQVGVGWDGSVIRDSGAFILATQTQKSNIWELGDRYHIMSQSHC